MNNKICREHRREIDKGIHVKSQYLTFGLFCICGTEMAFVVPLRRTLALLPSPDALLAVSKGMRPVELFQQNLPVINRGFQLTRVVL